ncbi:hypothetical protein QQF64_016364 [Cirrhinus molitorella]|uniref:Uncharacterized protein n=1 Tax=Cirrhinus molitorella TaxID=172907 RepID=A0ABR3LMK1_9TELE
MAVVSAGLHVGVDGGGVGDTGGLMVSGFGRDQIAGIITSSSCEPAALLHGGTRCCRKDKQRGTADKTFTLARVSQYECWHAAAALALISADFRLNTLSLILSDLCEPSHAQMVTWTFR